jgi:hypothetical protein
MANSINQNLQNNIISQSALEQFASILAPLNAFSTSFNDEASQRGNKVTILNLANTSSATDFGASTGYASQDTTYGQTQISLNKHKFVSWHISDKQRSESSAVELERFGYQKGADLAKAVFQDICSDIKNANYSDKKISGASAFDADDVADMRSLALGNNLPIEGCSLVLNNGHFTNLLKDSAVASALNYGSSDAIRGGNVPSLFGIPSVYETNSIPANSENLQGFLAHPCGLAVAMRYLEPSNTQEYISARKVSDPKTGLVMGYREFYDAKMGVQTAVLECVYGSAVGRGEGIVRLVSS